MISDPQMFAGFCASHLEILIASLNNPSHDTVTFHDIIQAYFFLSKKIRALRDVILSDLSYTAQSPLRRYSLQLVKVLKRDIRRALLDPVDEYRNKFHPNLSSHSVDDLTLQYLRDWSSLCQGALYLVLDIVSIPPLLSMLDGTAVSGLVGDLLSLLIKPLHILQENDIRKLVLWIFVDQRIPFDILRPQIEALCKALSTLISDGNEEYSIDCLQIIRDLLQRQSAEWSSHLCELLPSVMYLLTSDTRRLRVFAADVLAAFAHAKTDTPSTANTCFQSVPMLIATFIDKRRTDISNEIKANLNSDSSDHPLWAITVLSALIVLSDSQLFSHGRSLKLFINLAACVRDSPSSQVRMLLPHVWNCIVWAFGRLPQSGHDDTRTRALKIVQQELGGGIAAAIVANLLWTDDELDEQTRSKSSDPICQAISILQDMLSGKHRNLHREGVELLIRLLSAIGSTSPQVPYHSRNSVICKELFDGTCLHAQRDTLDGTVSTLQKPWINLVKPLSEAEICLHSDNLLVIWRLIVQRFLRNESSTKLSDILGIWQCILLANAHLSQGNSHLTSHPDFADKVTSHVCAFIFSSESTEQQLRHLSFTLNLWKVVANVFTTQLWLGPAAKIVLGKFVSVSWDLSSATIATIWIELCAHLVRVLPERLDEAVSILSGLTAGSEVKQQLWNKIALELDRPSTWEHLVSFLVVALCDWTMSQNELQTCETVLDQAVTACPFGSLRAIQHLLDRLKPDKYERLATRPKELLLIISHITYPDVDVLTILDIFGLVNRTLDLLYPPTPENYPIGLQYLSQINRMVLILPLSSVIELLVSMQHRLAYWFGDKTYLEDVDYNQVAMKLYGDSLNTLAQASLPDTVLCDLECFMMAPLLASRPPGLAIRVFKDFWFSFYDGTDVDSLPRHIKQLLWIFITTFDMQLVDELPDLGGITPSTVPDSQPPPAGSNEESFISNRFLAGPVSKPHEHRKLVPINFEFESMLASSPSKASPTRSVLQDLQSYTNSAEDSFPIVRPFMLHEVTSSHIPKKSLSSTDGKKRSRSFALKDGTPPKRRRTRARLKEHSTDSIIGIAQPSRSRTASRPPKLVFDGVFVPPLKKVRRTREIQLKTPPPTGSNRSVVSRASSPSEDYSSWEQGLSVEGLEDIDHTMPSKFVKQDGNTVASRDPSEWTRQTSSTVRKTNPESIHLEHLKHALHGIANDSHISDEDLVAASGLVYRIGSTINKRLREKLQTSRC